MPSITPQTRVQIGGETAPPARLQVKAGTSGSYYTNPYTNKESPDPSTSPILDKSTPSVETASQKEVTLSPGLTALARRQQKLQSEIEAFRQKEREFESSKGDFVSKKDFRSKLEALGEDALKDLGLSYEELANILVSRQNGADPVKDLQARLDQFEKKQEESTNAQFEATLKQYKAEVSSLVASEPKAFHLIKSENAFDAVVTHIVEEWKENPDTVLTVTQAAKEVEEFLRSEAKRYADSLKELEEPAQEPSQPTHKTLPPPKPRAQTLTPQSETTPQRSFNQMQHLSPKERLQEALKRAQR